MANRIEKAIRERHIALEKIEEKKSPVKSSSHRNLNRAQRDNDEIVNIQVSENVGDKEDAEEFQTIEMTHSARIDHNSQSEPEKCYPQHLSSLPTSQAYPDSQRTPEELHPEVPQAQAGTAGPNIDN